MMTGGKHGAHGIAVPKSASVLLRKLSPVSAVAVALPYRPITLRGEINNSGTRRGVASVIVGLSVPWYVLALFSLAALYAMPSCG